MLVTTLVLHAGQCRNPRACQLQWLDVRVWRSVQRALAVARPRQVVCVADRADVATTALWPVQRGVVARKLVRDHCAPADATIQRDTTQAL